PKPTNRKPMPTGMLTVSPVCAIGPPPRRGTVVVGVDAAGVVVVVGGASTLVPATPLLFTMVTSIPLAVTVAGFDNCVPAPAETDVTIRNCELAPTAIA